MLAHSINLPRRLRHNFEYLEIKKNILHLNEIGCTSHVPTFLKLLKISKHIPALPRRWSHPLDIEVQDVFNVTAMFEVSYILGSSVCPLHFRYILQEARTFSARTHYFPKFNSFLEFAHIFLFRYMLWICLEFMHKFSFPITSVFRQQLMFHFQHKYNQEQAINGITFSLRSCGIKKIILIILIHNSWI